MKKRGKRLLSMALASAMSLSMVTGWAANTVEIESIILNPGSSQTDVTNNETFNVTPSDVVQVTVKVKEGDTAKQVEATFLSALSTCFVNGENALTALDNGSIQYVDQKATSDSTEGGTDYKAVFTYRPRIDSNGALLVSGENTAKLGGTDVTDPKEFKYVVKDADITMMLFLATGSNNTFTAESSPEGGITYTITVTEGKTVPTTLGSVKINNSTLESTDYSYNNGTLTLTQTKLNSLTAGNYTLTVTAEGYYDATLTDAIVVNAKQDKFDETTSGTIKDELDNLDFKGTTMTEGNTTTVTLPETVKKNNDGTNNTVKITYALPDGTTKPEGVEIENNTVKLDTSKRPFAAVDVVAYVGKDDKGEDIKKQETIYIIPENTKVSFGNIGLMTNEKTDGNNTTYVDAFDISSYDSSSVDEAFKTAVNNNITEMLKNAAEVLNLALNNIDKDNSGLPHFTDAIDYNKDGTIALAEYRIYKLLVSGSDDIHTLTNVNNSRQDWINKTSK